MTLPPEPLPIRFESEIYYFLLLQRCGNCSNSVYKQMESIREFHGEIPVRRIITACGKCGARREFLFELRAPHSKSRQAPSACSHPAHDEDTREMMPAPDAPPSSIIDVSQWITLFHAILRASNAATSRDEARRLGFEAALCLHEALRFFRPDDEIPARDAFLSEQSFATSRLHPEQFSRSRLLAHRDKLPSLAAMRQRLERDAAAGEKPPLPWWRRLWRRRRS